MKEKQVGALLIAAVLLSGCCSYDGTERSDRRIDGLYYSVWIKSDFDDVMNVAYYEKYVKSERNFINEIINCYDYEEELRTINTRVNAFHGATFNMFATDGSELAFSVTYNGKIKTYFTQGVVNIQVHASDFH